MYTCTCIDSVMHNTACKHIHLVHMQEQQKSDIISSVHNMQALSSQKNTEACFNDSSASEQVSSEDNLFQKKHQEGRGGRTLRKQAQRGM